MSAKSGLECEELRPEVSPNADQIDSGECHSFPELIHSQTEASASGSFTGADLRELIRSMGGIRAVQELLRQRGGIEPRTPPQQPDVSRLRELARLLAKQHAAELLECEGQS